MYSDYTILSHIYQDGLSASVVSLMKKGWVLHGDPFIMPRDERRDERPEWCQAMVKPVRIDPSAMMTHAEAQVMDIRPSHDLRNPRRSGGQPVSPR